MIVDLRLPIADCYLQIGFALSPGRGWTAAAFSPAVAGRVRGQLHGPKDLPSRHRSRDRKPSSTCWVNGGTDGW